MTNKNLSISELILNSDGSIYHLQLLPEDIADTIITVGDPTRVNLVSDKFEKIRVKKSCREFVTHTGFYKGQEITVISTGIGTDNVDIVLNELDALANIDLKNRAVNNNLKTLDIYRIGTSGTIQPQIKIDSILISKAAVGLDGLMPFYGSGLKAKSDLTSSLEVHFQNSLPPTFYTQASPDLISLFQNDPNFIFGTTLTMPGFYAPQGRALRLNHPIQKMMEKLVHFRHNNTQLTNIEMETAGIYGLAELLGHNAISVNAILANRMNGEFSNSAEATIDRAINLTLEKIIERGKKK